jgi:cytohesin
LIPSPLTEKLSPEGLRATLIHELAHIKRGDLWVNAVQTFLQVVYFYNPFVWIANSVIRRVCEEAVDETVLVALGGQAKDYSNTLIDIGEMVFWRADLGLRLVGVAESKKALQWRIRHMLNRPIPKSSKLGALGIIAVLAIAAVLLPMARAQKSGQENEPAAAVSEGQPAKSLHQAAKDGDLEQVKKLIAQGADVNAMNNQGRTPLHLAAFHGHREVAALLVARGADVNTSMRDDPWTPLLDAACTGRTQVVKLLLQHEAKVDAGDSHGYTPLLYAIWSADEESVRTLISAGADVNKRPSKDDSLPLFYAVWHGHAGIVKAIMDAGANVNAEDDNGWTPLRYAIEATSPDMINLFMGTGAKIPDFHRATLQGNLAKVREFVESGVDVDTRDKLGWTPSYWAVSAGNEEVFKYLLSHGASVKVKTNHGRTLLHQASQAGLAEMVKLLIAKGADVNAAADDGKIPLGDSALNGHDNVVRLLLANGANINLSVKGKGTALHASAWNGHSTIVEFLITKGADVNVDSTEGTPLHLAAGASIKVGDKRCAEIVRTLLDEGADVNAKKIRNGSTALHGAAFRGRTQTTEILIGAGANVSAKNDEGLTPLHNAARRGQHKAAKVLIAAGSDTNATDNEGHTALWHANNRGHSDVVKLLRIHGAKE